MYHFLSPKNLHLKCGIEIFEFGKVDRREEVMKQMMPEPFVIIVTIIFDTIFKAINISIINPIIRMVTRPCVIVIILIKTIRIIISS